MILVYALPLVVVANRRRPKYMETLAVTSWSLQDFGLVLLAIVRASVTPAQNSSLIGNSDVLPLGPENRDLIPTPAELTQLTTILEQNKIPTDLIAADQTWREVIHIILALFQFAQQCDFLGIDPYPPGITLETRWNNMPVTLQNGLKQAAVNLSYSTALMQGTNRYRVILVDVMTSFPGPILLGGEAF